MGRSRKEIVQDLLWEANYYWHDENEDNVNPLRPEDFDPVVDMLFKANAVELEKLYAELDESRKEITLALAKALVPDQSLLPEPGFTVAQLTPKAERLQTTPEDRYFLTGQSETGDQHEYYLTPLFAHDFPKCELRAVLTDQTAVQWTDKGPKVVQQLLEDQMTGSIWLGLELAKTRENDRISFFLGNQIVDVFNKDYYVIHHAKWLLNGQLPLVSEVGVAGFNTARIAGRSLLDELDVPDSAEKQIKSRCRNSFIHLKLPSTFEQYRVPPDYDGSELTAKLTIEHPLTWIKLELPFGIADDFLLRHPLYPNCIPLLNRNRIERSVVKSSYDRILLPMPTVDLFLDVDKVQDTRNKEDDPESSYQRVNFLHPDNHPGTYAVRSGSRIRRLNRQDASRRIHRLLEVIQDEYSTFKEEGANRLREDFSVIERAINRIRTQLPDYFRESNGKANFYGVANFRPRASRLYYSYWETQGDAIQGLGDKIGLKISSNEVKLGIARSVIPTQRGKGQLTSDDFINQLKESLLSRGRITTKGDIVIYCDSRYGKLLRVTDIRHEVMVLEAGNRGRGIIVQVTFYNPEISDSEREYLKVELQNDLNARSAFFTQIKVLVQ